MSTSAYNPVGKECLPQVLPFILLGRELEPPLTAYNRLKTPLVKELHLDDQTPG